MLGYLVFIQIISGINTLYDFYDFLILDLQFMCHPQIVQLGKEYRLV